MVSSPNKNIFCQPGHRQSCRLASKQCPVPWPRRSFPVGQNTIGSIELPQTDYAALGRAMAELENTEPLLTDQKDQYQHQSGKPAVSESRVICNEHHRGEKMKRYISLIITIFVPLVCVLANQPATIELKNKSSFKMPGDRNPFWPIGWKPAGTAELGDQAASDIPSYALRG